MQSCALEPAAHCGETAVDIAEEPFREIQSKLSGCASMADEPQGGGDRSVRKSKAKPIQHTDARGSDAGLRPSGSDRPLTAIGGATPEVVAVPVIGIGASAGGIEALSRFFDVMPADSGCAFVVVLHLDPKRESELARILNTHTTMPVVQVEDGMRLAANHVYVIAPDSDLKVSAGGLHVSKPTAPRGPVLPGEDARDLLRKRRRAAGRPRRLARPLQHRTTAPRIPQHGPQTRRDGHVIRQPRRLSGQTIEPTSNFFSAPPHSGQVTVSGRSKVWPLMISGSCPSR